jgi:hypothetical protein
MHVNEQSCTRHSRTAQPAEKKLAEHRLRSIPTILIQINVSGVALFFGRQLLRGWRQLSRLHSYHYRPQEGATQLAQVQRN